METNHDKIQQALSKLRDDTITSKQVKQFVDFLVNIVKVNKEDLKSEFASVSQENVRKIHEAIQIISEKHYDILDEVTKKHNVQKEDFATKLSEIRFLVAEAKAARPQDGNPGKDARPEDVVPLVLKKLPKIEEIDRLNIVKKINTGDKNDLKIERKQIAGLEDFLLDKDFKYAIGKLQQQTSFLINRGASNFTLKTTGSSGPATYANGILNIPQYSGGGGGTTYLVDGDNTTVSGTGTLVDPYQVDVALIDVPTTFIDQTPDNGAYTLLSGSVNGSNRVFTVSQGAFIAGHLQVYLNGLIQAQGGSADYTETTPGSGTFTFNTAPETGDVITAVYTNAVATTGQLSPGTNITITGTGTSGDPYVISATGGGGGGGTWGSITGTLSDQTDLQTVLDTKVENLGDLGITATATELNYTDGVTSSIQTQLDAKQVALSGTGFVKISGTTISYDNSTYLTTTSAASTYQPLDSDLTSWATVTRASGFDTFATTPTSANLKSLVTDETGSGALVFATSPTLVTPALGVATATSINGATITSGTLNGSVTGTNTGDQTISITGDVTAAGSTGTLSATVTKINGTSLAGLATGILKNTTTTGVPSIAVAADFPTLNQNTTGSAATLTTTRTIWGQNFNGSANVTGTLALGTADLTLTGSIGATGARATKVWTTDLEMSNLPSVGGTALTTTIAKLNLLTSAAGTTGTTSTNIVFSTSPTLITPALGTPSALVLTNATGLPIAGLSATGTPSSTTFLRGDNTWATPAGGGGSGTVTNTGGNLTANSVVLGAGTVDVKVIAGITTDGTSQLNLGVASTTLGKLKLYGNTSGDVTIQPAAVAGTSTVLTLPSTTGTLMHDQFAAYSFYANNTASTATRAATTFKEAGAQTLASTLNWTAGAAPTSLISSQYVWHQIGKRVFSTFYINFSSPGTTVSAVQFALPTDMPAPLELASTGAANEFLYMGQGYIGTQKTTDPGVMGRASLMVNSGDTGWDIKMQSTSVSARVVWFTLDYTAA